MHEDVTLSVKELFDYTGMTNIAEEIKGRELAKIAKKVMEDFDADRDSMSDWDQMTKLGLELVKPPTKGRSQPWEGASNFKSPALLEAANKFGERASREILRPKNLCMAEVIGTDKDGEKAKRAERVATYQSYQVNHEIPEWREEQRQLLYRLPNMGCMFKDTYFDPVEGHFVSQVVHYPNFAVDQSSPTMAKLPRFSKLVSYESDDMEEFQRAGIWLEDVEIKFEVKPENKDEDSEDKFIEQYTNLDLDGDGYGEPYLVVVHPPTQKVLRILAMFQIEDVVVRDGDDFKHGDEIYGPLEDEFGTVDDYENAEEGEKPEQKNGMLEEGKSYDIVRIDRNWTLSKYGFIPSPDGSFLDVGYFQMMGALVQSINTGTNQLFDAATLANLQGGYYAKGVRKKMGNDRFKPGVFKQTDILPKDLQGSIMPLVFKEPSQTMLAMVESFKNDALRLASASDMSDVFGPNTAATTVLGLLEEAMSTTTSLMKSVTVSMGNEFKVMYRLNRQFADPKEYQRVLDDEAADYKKDFGDKDLDIQPTANPENSNQIKRIQVAQIEMNNLEQLVANGADGYEICRSFIEVVDSDNVDSIFPERTEDFMAAQTANQQAQAAQSEAQAAWFDADKNRMLQETQYKGLETKIKIDKLPEELEKLKAETILLLEKAESEDAKNLLDKYTAHIDAFQKIYSAIEATNNDLTNRPESRPEIPAIGNAGTPNQRRSAFALAQ